MFDWMIIGGGIQGVTLATFLLKTGKTTVDQLAIVDINDEPLARWKQCTEVISMPYLRSPSVHHLNVKPFSPQTYVKKMVTIGILPFTEDINAHHWQLLTNIVSILLRIYL